jgi:uncharacterized protein YqgV (UPF0045/DUF77 family)
MHKDKCTLLTIPREGVKKIKIIFFLREFGIVNVATIPLGIEKKRVIKMIESAKKERRTEWMQIRVTPQEKEFLKQTFGDQTAFVRAAIRQAAKERGVALPN